MAKHPRAALLACLFLLSGCADAPPAGQARLPAAPAIELPPPPVAEDPGTAPADGGVVWNIETSDAPVGESEDAVIPEGADPSLAEDALAAAFSLVRQQRDVAEVLGEGISLTASPPDKAGGVFRIALMLPQEGESGAVGRDIQGGAELAMFKLAPRDVDMVFIDTSRGIDTAVAEARSSGADVVLGPLFSGNTAEVHRRLRGDGVPVISFSNDIRIAAPGVFLLGQTPEQEIEAALGHVLATVRPAKGSGRTAPAVAILAGDSTYGARVADRAERILLDRGLAPATNVVLDQGTLGDEGSLREAVRNLARWIPSAGGGGRSPPYDVVVLAGDVSFSLRVAPVLAWYDLDPQRIRFVGTSLWSSPAILQEPSLQQGIYADSPLDRRRDFDRLWRETGAAAPGGYARLGFDAVALSAALSSSGPAGFRDGLAGREGFAGFSGSFRFEADGRNTRLLDVVEIDAGAPRVLAKAPPSF